MALEEKRIEDELSYTILLSERVRATAAEAELFKYDCAEVGKQVDRLCQMLRTMVRFATTTPFLYEPPIRHVVAEVSKNLERVLILVRKCKHQSFLRRVVNRVSSADFRKVLNILEASIGDMKWLINIFDADGDEGGKVVIQHSMPPIASNDPMLSWIWSDVATVQMGIVDDRCEAAKELASLAKDNDRNKKIIVEEGGVPPILKLFKESTLPEVQIEAATALYHLANNRERVRTIVNELAIPIIVQVLGDSSMGVQIQAASLVARMAEHDPVAQECFARENVIRPLVTLLSFETFVDDHTGQLSKQSIHSIVKINKEIEKNSLFKSNGTRPLANSYKHMEGISRVGHYSKKERENESPEIKLELKICCARALWMLATGSVSNSRKLTETKGLLCLAKIVEKDQGGLQFNCLMTIMEIAIAAESNADLRCAAFKTNSPAAKAVVDQLLRVIEELDNPSLQIPAIKSIGSLARTFPARETRVIGSLVTRLSHRNLDIAAEAAIALGKFACPENFLCMNHSKAIIEFKAIPQLMRLLRSNEHNQLHGIFLLCYLSLHAGNSESLEQARVLTALEGAERTVLAHHPKLRELATMAIYHLNLYHAGVQSQRIVYLP